MAGAPQQFEVLGFLETTALFKGLKQETLSRLALASRQLRVARGTTLCRKDEQCAGLFMVVLGQVRLMFLSPSGGEKTLEILHHGDTFCESTLLLDVGYPAYAHTLEECLLLHVAKPAILAELDGEPELARRLLTRLARRLSDRIADIESYSLHTGRQRLIHYLLREISAGNGCYASGANSPSLGLKTAKGVLASRLNMTQEHFSRLLHELVQDGLLSVTGRNIRITSLEMLERLALHPQ